ncbi:MAG: TROVE domain-containing protein [Methylobacteriaceae bacterium]|jgi:60 kDa SS-A/Ro ribonucleoprotein|nr:TROVE domain-containing protein [Methylobacteriaceae bacterium]
MANKSIFGSAAGKILWTDIVNEAGGTAYELSAEQKLAQLAATGTMSRTFYATAEAQLDEVLAVVNGVSPEFVAKTAVYARERGYMKDMPALLLAWLSSVRSEHFTKVFHRVVDNGKMLRTFAQIVRSGATGRKSFGIRPKKMILNWLETATDAAILRASVGQDPSLADIIKMVHPKPASKAREALFGWLIGKPYDILALPGIVRDYIAFKADPAGRDVPDVPFQLLTSLPLTRDHWMSIGEKAGWHMIRMNLNTFGRHGAFKDDGFTRMIADKLRNAEAIKHAKVFPYQLMTAFNSIGAEVPAMIRDALQDAMKSPSPMCR